MEEIRVKLKINDRFGVLDASEREKIKAQERANIFKELLSIHAELQHEYPDTFKISDRKLIAVLFDEYEKRIESSRENDELSERDIGR